MHVHEFGEYPLDHTVLFERLENLTIRGWHTAPHGRVKELFFYRRVLGERTYHVVHQLPFGAERPVTGLFKGTEGLFHLSVVCFEVGDGVSRCITAMGRGTASLRCGNT